MLQRFVPRSRRVGFWVLPLLLALRPVAHAQTSGGYTITALVTGNTPRPGSSGTFSVGGPGYGGTTSTDPVIDGDTVVFFDPTGGDESHGALWAVSASGATAPVRLVDATTTAPGNSGPFVYTNGIGSNFALVGISNGSLGFFGISPEGMGLYSVPVGGGAVTTLVNVNSTQPHLTKGPPFQYIYGAAVDDGQLVFNVDRNGYNDGAGIFTVPLTGGAFTVVGDKTTPITGDPNGTLTPGSDRIVAAKGNIVAFEPELPTNNYSGDTALYTAPITGLTVDPMTGYANNATRVAGAETLVPGDPQGRTFDPQFEFGGFGLDDSGATVFIDYPAGASLSASGIYSSVNGVVIRLVDTTTPLTGRAGNFIDLSVSEFCVANGQVVFTGDYQGADGTMVEGIYQVAVSGGPISKVVEAGDSFALGTVSPYALNPASVRGDGTVVFQGSYYPSGSETSVDAIFVASPGGGTTQATNTLVLSNHTGGDTGVVTLTVTAAPGTAALMGGAAFKLSASGKADIAAQSATLDAAGTAYLVTFDLTGQADALYDLVVTNADGSTLTQAGAFTVEPGTSPVVYGEVIGRYLLRAGQPQTYTMLVGNRGDVDAAMVPVFFSYPNFFGIKVVSVLATPPQPVGLAEPLDFSQVPLTYTNGDQNVLPLIVPRVPAGSLVTIQVLLTVPDVPQYAHNDFNLSMALGEPFLDAATGLVPAVPVAAAHPGDGGKHTEDATDTQISTCLAGLFNVAVDCGGFFFPPLGAEKCLANGILYFESSYANLASNNADPSYGAYELGQVEAGGLSLALTCAKVLPGLGTIINAVNCGLDTYLLYDNCIRPAIIVPIQTIVSGDPNDLDGSLGDGSPAHYLTGAQPLSYVVSFENEPTASAPAQNVTITNPLDANLDLSTFRLGPISFGSTLLNPPAGAQNFSTVVDLRPATNLLVQITAALNAASRTLTCSFHSLDPATNQPPTDPTVGFLPPDVSAPAGDGFLVYYVKPTAGLPTGTTVNEQASIVFDVNAAIATPTWTNTIDNDAPTSQVTALPAKEKTAQIALNITGIDNGSGVHYFNLYVSEDGGAFTPLVRNAVGPAVTFTGVTGHTYAFFSQAVDGAGNAEPLKTAAETKTKIRGADLIGVWKDAVTEKETASGRTKLTGKFKVTNQSPQTATSGPSVVRLYLSASATLGTGDPVLGADLPFAALAPGASVNVSFKNVKVPKASTASGMYVIAVIDPDSNVKETDRSNNTVAYGPLP